MSNNTQTPEDKFKLITRNLNEVLGAEQMQNILKERDLVAYWGSAPTGRPHLGYFVPLTKLADFLQAGVKLKILLADVHAFLDNLKAPLELVASRVRYYEQLIRAVFKSLALPIDQVEFIVGSSYQYSAEYNLDKYKLCSITSEHDARKAGAEVVKQVESPLLSSVLYPLLQALDEEYLGVDFQFGGVDQRKIFTYAEAYLPRIGYRKRSHLMNNMVPGLSGGKMSSSDPNSKIDFLDGPDAVRSKISKALCAEGEVEGNGILAFIQHVVVPIGELYVTQKRERAWVFPEDSNMVFTVRGDAKHNVQDRSFATYAQLEKAYAAREVHPKDLKASVVIAINALLEPIQAEFASNKAFSQAEADAYPVETKVAVTKKKKERGTDAYEKPSDEEIERRRLEKAAKKAEKEAAKARNANDPSSLNDTSQLKAALP